MTTAPPHREVVLPPNWREIVKDTRNERRKVFVSEKEVARALEWLRESRAASRQVLRKARDGDAVEVDFEISSDEKPLPGGKAEGHRLILGKGGYIPGFEDAVRGMSQGEEREVLLSVPENYWAKEIAGKTLSAKIKVKQIHERTLPELSDEFAKSVGRFNALPDLEKSIREGLFSEKGERERQRFRLLLLEKIDRASTITFSQELLEKEVAAMLGELRSSVAAMGLAWSDYLRQIKKDERALASDFQKQAGRRVRFSLILEAIAEKEAIEPTTEEVEEETTRVLLRFSSPKETEKNIDVPALARYSRGVLRNEKVFQHLEKIAH